MQKLIIVQGVENKWLRFLNISASYKAQRTWQRNRQKEYRNRRMGRNAVKSCFLDMAWLLLTWTYRSCNMYKFKTAKNSCMDGRRAHEAQTLLEELLAVDCCWRRENHLGVWPLAIAHAQMDDHIHMCMRVALIWLRRLKKNTSNRRKT